MKIVGCDLHARQQSIARASFYAGPHSMRRSGYFGGCSDIVPAFFLLVFSPAIFSFVT